MQFRIPRSLHLALIAAISMLTACGSVVHDDPHAQAVVQLSTPYIDGHYIIGMSVGVIRDGQQYTYHFGNATESGDAPDDHTLYEIGSITKTMTGLLLAEGVTREAYTLETPVSALLQGDARLDERVTLGRLATHTSGLPRLPGNLTGPGFDSEDPYAHYGERQLLDYLGSASLPAPPGASVQYSNLGFGLLGYALANQSDTDYETLLARTVFEPFGMSQSGISPATLRAHRLAQPHNADGDRVAPWHLGVLAGAGGVRSSLHDMLRYAEAQLHPQRTPLSEAILLSQSRHTGEGLPAVGLGWFIADDGWLNHSGQTGGFHCMVCIHPERRTAIVVLTNTANGRGSELAGQLMRYIESDEVEPVGLPRVIELTPGQLDRYVGDFHLGLAGVMQITRRGNRLYARLADQPAVRVFPADESWFHYRAVEASLEFEIGKGGEVPSLKLHQNGRVITGRRVRD